MIELWNDDSASTAARLAASMGSERWTTLPADNDLGIGEADSDGDEIDDEQDDVEEDEDLDDDDDDEDEEEPGGDYADLPAPIEPTEPWPMP